MKIVTTIQNCEITEIGEYESAKLKKKVQTVRFDFIGGSIRTENHCPDIKEGMRGECTIQCEGRQIVMNDFSQMAFNPSCLVGFKQVKG